MIDRIFHHYEDLEEWHNGMWRIVRGEKRKDFINAAANLMKDAQRFTVAMRRGINEWPNSCENSLTTDAVNHLAFLGHVGCCIATGSPEECTRVAWHTLNEDEQKEANRVAALVVDEWFLTKENQKDFFRC